VQPPQHVGGGDSDSYRGATAPEAVALSGADQRKRDSGGAPWTRIGHRPASPNGWRTGPVARQCVVSVEAISWALNLAAVPGGRDGRPSSVREFGQARRDVRPSGRGPARCAFITYDARKDHPQTHRSPWAYPQLHVRQPQPPKKSPARCTPTTGTPHRPATRPPPRSAAPPAPPTHPARSSLPSGKPQSRPAQTATPGTGGTRPHIAARTRRET
jgi:hypothetical protein